MKKKQIKWMISFVVLIILTLVDFTIPDPIPFIDEIIFIVVDILVGRKALG